jgi:hypothetical protein
LIFYCLSSYLQGSKKQAIPLFKMESSLAQFNPDSRFSSTVFLWSVLFYSPIKSCSYQTQTYNQGQQNQDGSF